MNPEKQFMSFAVRALVSIPFKREGRDKVSMTTYSRKHLQLFQFPSNGKEYTKINNASSICILNNGRFNSLQTGRPIQRNLSKQLSQILAKFQFPSNGKDYTKNCRVRWTRRSRPVSIPFKREDLSKDKPRQSNSDIDRAGFHSLQTGKGIQSIASFITLLTVHLKFPFPSNGKGYPKTNSQPNSARSSTSFNSLQTGKGIQSMKAFSFFQGRLKVSIPFKRERVSKDTTTSQKYKNTS